MKTTTTETDRPLRAFHNDPKIKAEYLARVQAHRQADQLVQGYGYWKDGKGCAVGCTIHSDQHAAYETELGIPQLIARLQDGIFEGLAKEDARLWPEQFLEGIPVGADLTMVGDRFLHWLLVNNEDGVIKFSKTDQARAAIQAVADLYGKKITGETVTLAQWRTVRDNALAAKRANAATAADATAAANAAYAAATAAAANAAYAAYAAANAAANAAYAAATAAAARKRQAEKLLELMGSAAD